MEGLTPMMRQYLDIKEHYRDAILFFRLGDFYEMFLEDAELASRLLEITLTSREGGSERRVPMCGIPYHAAEGYIARLIEQGYKVAICEQVEDPREAKGIVRREVIRLITPGTFTDTGVLDEKKNNYLVAVHHQHNGFGLAAADVSTGEFLATDVAGEFALHSVMAEVTRLQPAEILLSQSLAENRPLVRELEQQGVFTVSPFRDRSFSHREAYRTLTEHFHTNSLAGFGGEEFSLAVATAGGLLAYLQETQKISLGHLSKITFYRAGQYMNLDSATRRNLELLASQRSGSRQGSLLGVLDRTVTAMGGRLLKNWISRPLIEVEAVRSRLQTVDLFYQDGLLRADLRALLQKVYDLERLVGKVAYGKITPREMLALKQSLQQIPALRQLLVSLTGQLVEEIYRDMDPLAELVDLLERAISDDAPLTTREGGVIKSGFNPEVDELRQAASGGKEWLARLESRERERTGIKSLKVGFNKVFGYYLEITNANKDLAPVDYIRKQTLANAERYITQELKEFETKILGAEDRLLQLEYEIFGKVREEVARHTTRIQRTARAVATADVLTTLAETAAANGYTAPVINDSGALKIHDGRHPVVERNLERESFIPNDTHLDPEQNRLLIITGPNMAGKSTYMRQVALIVLLAQIGSFVSATAAEIGLVDRIFTRVGASDDLATGQSTFMVEMNEVANILNNASPRSLIILDEIGRGTSTFDGLSIAWAVAEYIHDRKKIGAKTLFATHYHELTGLADTYRGIQNYCVAVRERGEDIVFLRKIVPGSSDRSYGIQVARLAGLPQVVLERARIILTGLEMQNYSGAAEVAAANEEDRLPERVRQLALFEEAPEHPVVEEIKTLDLLMMTPLEALNKLYEIQQRLK